MFCMFLFVLQTPFDAGIYAAIIGVLVIDPESIYGIENFQRYDLLLRDEQRSVLHDQVCHCHGKECVLFEVVLVGDL